MPETNGARLKEVGHFLTTDGKVMMIHILGHLVNKCVCVPYFCVPYPEIGLTIALGMRYRFQTDAFLHNYIFPLTMHSNCESLNVFQPTEL